MNSNVKYESPKFLSGSKVTANLKVFDKQVKLKGH